MPPCRPLTVQDPTARMVVQMSFGDYTSSPITSQLLDRLYARGDMLFVASAGNDQLTNPGAILYPAGYAPVISVAAVDCNGTVAPFSEENSKVELAAPGVAVLSTVKPSTPDATSLSVTTASGYTSHPPTSPVLHSRRGTYSGLVVDCGLGKLPCPSATGKMCLIERGDNTFSCKHRNAQLGGCKAVLLYNNVQPACTPLTDIDITSADCTLLGKYYLPIATMSLADGLLLAASVQKGNTTATLSVQPGTVANWYAKYDGTSMAAPYVSGVAARVWAPYPGCNNTDVRFALDTGATVSAYSANYSL